jgi:hypothetical protein
MDPITQALATALTKLAEPAVKDAYDALKGALVRRFGPHSDATKAVESMEAKPESEGRRTTVAEEMKSAGAVSDEELLRLAQALAAALKGASAGTHQTVYQSVSGHDNQTTVSGDINVYKDGASRPRSRRDPRSR